MPIYGKFLYFSAQSIPYPTMNLSSITNPTQSTGISAFLLSGLSKSVHIFKDFGSLAPNSFVKLLKVNPESIMS